MALYTRPSDIVTAQATWVATAGTVDARYPVANLTDPRAYLVARAVGTTITYQGTFPAPVTIAALAFINTNATAIHVTNAAGLSYAVTIPALPADGHHLDPWADLRLAANTTSAVWSVALTGPAGVALAIPLLLVALREIKIQWAPNPADKERHAAIVHKTDYGTKRKLGLGVRERGLRGGLLGDTTRADVLALERDARGPLRNFLLIPDEAHNDALYVDLATDLRELLYVAPGDTDGEFLHSITLEFDEQQKGWL
jgi:hypothetical protein